MSKLNILITGDDGYNSAGVRILARVLQKDYNVWIAANAMIMQGVTVKENSVIAANSLLTKETSKNSLYMGIPAIKKKTLNIE